MTISEPTQMETRARLLEAAGQVFAERGFHQTTVREICERANANVAAVNYYFRGKEDLYTEVLKSWAEVAFAKYPPLLGLSSDAPPEERLRAFIRSFLSRLLDQGRPAWHGRIIAREMADPSPAFETIISTFFAPTILILSTILSELIGGKPDPVLQNRLLASIAGQILFYSHGRSLMERMTGPFLYDSVEIESLAEYVTQFSLAGIRQILAHEHQQEGV